ncbi:hypothetical protein DL93DRAFT_2087463 [Clavulina sp. PMI_390]|nr:hypothetical protein DL93DRAFT_2087463 [Clavulina sp. PMI_390]
MEYNLPAVKRVVTGHNEQGQSTPIIVDDTLMSAAGPANPTKLARFWMTKETPVDNDDQKTDFKAVAPARFGLIQPNGSHAVIMDLPPGRRGPTHRTSSIDYMILISGSLTLLLDTDAHSSSPDVGTTIDVPGSVIVQRGTMHTWVNRSTTEWARCIAIIIDAKAVELEVDGDGNGEEVNVLHEEFRK